MKEPLKNWQFYGNLFDCLRTVIIFRNWVFDCVRIPFVNPKNRPDNRLGSVPASNNRPTLVPPSPCMYS
jgi:hypothetical protein